MKKTEINYANGSISNDIKYKFYLNFGIDIIDLFENIFRIDSPYKDPSWIREKYVYGFNHSSKPSNLRYLKSIRIDDYKLDKNGKVLYMDLLVDTNMETNKYIVYFDHLNNFVEVELNEDNKEDIRYKYHYISKNATIKENEEIFIDAYPILSKVTLFNKKDESLRFSKIFTKKEEASLSFEKDNIKYKRLKYKFENSCLESYIIMDIEDKESRSYTEIDSERNKVYRNNLGLLDVIDSYMMMLNNANEVESTLMLYEKIKEQLLYIKDNYKYEINIETRLKRLGNLSNYPETITDKNGVITLNTNLEDIKRKVKK